MCTLTWIRLADGYELYFNRDEKRTRTRALAPRLRERAGTRWIAPTDPDGGGSWLGVNEHGLAVGLLNGYRSGDSARRDFESRGALVDALLDSRSGAELRARLARVDLTRFRSFALVAFEVGERVVLVEWSGARVEQRELDDAEQPICSSSLDPVGASASRKRLYAAWFASRRPDRAALERFHASHEPERGALSPCMHRDDAETVSSSHVVVDGARVVFEYTPSAPCQGAARSRLELARSSASRAAAS